ncbi:bacteriohemerythrin [Desulfovibrio sp. 86]|uniref:Hemerythrin-like metal-binding protein n=1 Tax=uncultured Desulfovibrio sp. TaxID=167968 RepID=A0A212KZ41_9BACT|nr:bacteriohemerythrin [Desulfovibrio sp. 86]SCM70558.1 Hemerythrin-like metal-binding protein [uncultured Desulfovibrio sp.]VZH32354.1 Hemerythrin-like metal-binding protein [Desulfovibrio sp. 86]
MPAFFILLAVSPAISALGLLLSPPLSYAAGTAGLVCGFGGLFLLYQDLLKPFKTICSSLRKPGTLNLPPVTDCGALCHMAELMAAHDEAHTREVASARRDLDKMRQDAAECHEKYTIAMSGQVMTKDSLHEAARKLRLLAADQAEQERKLAGICPELAETAFFGGLTTQWMDKVAAELEYCENYLAQMNAFLGDTPASSMQTETAREEEFFQWTPSYSTGVPVIDGQHKLLLSYVNKLHNGLRQGSDSVLLLEILDALAGYAFTHFTTEEIFFTYTDYPLCHKHIEEHQSFKNKIMLFREALLQGKADVDLTLLEFLKTWLIEHIQGMDVSFAPYVAQHHSIALKTDDSAAGGAERKDRTVPHLPDHE